MRDAATTPSPERDNSPSISDPDLLEAICGYGFGVVLEVTNGITNNSKRQEKKKQVKRARTIMQQMVGEEAKIVCGIALIKTGSQIKNIQELDFILRMERYNPTLLGNTAQRVLESGRLDGESRKILEMIVDREKKYRTQTVAEYLQRQHAPPARGSHGRDLPWKMQSTKQYTENVAKIKGIVLEEYVKTLFMASVNPVVNYSIGTQVMLRSGPQLGNKETCVDIIIAAHQSDFVEALKNMESIYSQKRQRLTIERHDGLTAPLQREKEKTFKRRPNNSVNETYRPN